MHKKGHSNMITIRVNKSAAAALALIAISNVAWAAGRYDGNWVFDFPSAGAVNSFTNEGSCGAFRVPVQIANDQISGSLGVGGYGGAGSGSLRSGGYGSSASPVTGTVQPNGSLRGNWQNWTFAGQLANARGDLTIAKSQCGPRKGTAYRVAQ